MSGEETPCEDCPDKPVALFASNALAWQIWSLLNEFDRPFASGMAVFPLPIPSRTMLDQTDGMGGTDEDFERVCMIERAMWPAIQKQYQKD